MNGDEVDPITFEVVRHRLWQIAEEMGITLMRVSGSPVVTEAYDFCSGLFLPDGTIGVYGGYSMLNVAAVSVAVKNLVKDFTEDPGINEGDMFLVNDPWYGALHQADMEIISPIFHQDELVTFSGLMAHMLDIGAMTPGGYVAGATEVYHEGLCLTPVKIVEGGKVRKDIFNMIMNMVREKRVALDLKALIAANHTGRRAMVALCDKYGRDPIKHTMAKLLDYTEEKFRERLKKLPDGIYRHTDYIDHDGVSEDVHRITLKLTKTGDALEFDFTGTSPPSPGCINCALPAVYGGILTATIPWLAYDLPYNGGLLRPVRVIVPDDCLINAKKPSAVSMTSTGSCWVLRNVVSACYSKMLSTSSEFAQDVQAVWGGGPAILEPAGVDQYGERFAYVLLDTIALGCGARSSADGPDSCGDANTSIQAIPNIETHESMIPFLFLARRRAKDSGGAGKFRGGTGMEIITMIYDTDRCQLVYSSHGSRVPNNTGLFGGYPGAGCTLLVKTGTDMQKFLEQGKLPDGLNGFHGKTELLPAKVAGKWLNEYDVIHYWWAGGGGYGDPLERAPAAVLTDFLNGTVSLKAAEGVYGVVIDPTEMVVDEMKTEKKRSGKLEQRLKAGGRP